MAQQSLAVIRCKEPALGIKKGVGIESGPRPSVDGDLNAWAVLVNPKLASGPADAQEENALGENPNLCTIKIDGYLRGGEGWLALNQIVIRTKQ